MTDQSSPKTTPRRWMLLFLVPAVLLIAWQRLHPGMKFGGLPVMVVRTMGGAFVALGAVPFLGRRWRCPLCGGQLRRGWNFCPHCYAKDP
jgi:hypothetical protein